MISLLRVGIDRRTRPRILIIILLLSSELTALRRAAASTISTGITLIILILLRMGRRERYSGDVQLTGQFSVLLGSLTNVAVLAVVLVRGRLGTIFVLLLIPLVVAVSVILLLRGLVLLVRRVGILWLLVGRVRVVIPSSSGSSAGSDTSGAPVVRLAHFSTRVVSHIRLGECESIARANDSFGRVVVGEGNAASDERVSVEAIREVVLVAHATAL